MRIHHVALRTRDLARLERFYVGVLGLSVTRRQEHGVWLDAGGTILMLERAGDDEPDVASGTKELVAFAIGAGDHADYVSRLSSAGYAVEARTASTIYVRDPDGRRVGLSAYPDVLKA